MANETGEGPTKELTSSEAGALAEEEMDDRQAIGEVLVPFEDEADRLRAKALGSHYEQVSRPFESVLDITGEALFTERNQPILDDHNKLEAVRLKQLRAEVKAGRAPITKAPNRTSGK